ncbi:MAG: ribosomal-processing cysteine protease Prp [Clostridia bacterium]|nr:ribosomal-processing cysteine protease Prp [Clostridia bacterium]
MTRIVLQEGPNGIEGFKVTGHSGYGEAGTDIVCAAISILTTTCVNALESVAGVAPQVIQRDEPVLLEVTLPKGLSAQAHHDAQVLMKALRQGLQDLSQAYPKNVQLQERRKHP